MLDPLNIPENQIFYVNTTLAPEKAAIEYTKAINKHFNGADLSFDLILLGMGDDAHTASLFPETAILKNKEADYRFGLCRQTCPPTASALPHR